MERDLDREPGKDRGLIFVKPDLGQFAILYAMGAFLFRCPNTGLKVQAWSADDVSADAARYEATTCTACRQAHLVNPSTGKVMGDKE
jgi:hypothetical protein